jgi:hypothetical protein
MGERYPVVGGQRMPQAARTPTYGAPVAPVFQGSLPVLLGKRMWQAALTDDVGSRNGLASLGWRFGSAKAARHASEGTDETPAGGRSIDGFWLHGGNSVSFSPVECTTILPMHKAMRLKSG